MSNLTINYIGLDKLIPYVNNSRTHDEAQVAQIASSIKEFGFTNPILIDDEGSIIAGHGRVMAARKLSLDTVPTITLSGLSDIQKRAYIIADNKLALNAGWDNELLMLELNALSDADYDLDLTGFSADEISDLMPEQIAEGLTDEDAVPDVPEVPHTVLGDVWLLGKHRVMCGDSTSIDAVEKLMDGQKADMVFTSPPYNANTKFGSFSSNMGALYDDGYKDNLNSFDYVNFCKDVLEICFLKADGFIFWNVNYNANSRFEYIQQIQNRLPNLIEQICWKKTSVIPYHSGLRRMWEPIFVFKTSSDIENVGVNGIVQDNFWEISNTGSQMENHRGCFPVELPEKAIELVIAKTSILFDPFGGSGSTLIACEKTAREARLMELDEKYVDVIVKRWQEFTGKKAIHADTGLEFPV